MSARLSSHPTPLCIVNAKAFLESKSAEFCKEKTGMCSKKRFGTARCNSTKSSAFAALVNTLGLYTVVYSYTYKREREECPSRSSVSDGVGPSPSFFWSFLSGPQPLLPLSSQQEEEREGGREGRDTHLISPSSPPSHSTTPGRGIAPKKTLLSSPLLFFSRGLTSAPLSPSFLLVASLSPPLTLPPSYSDLRWWWWEGRRNA